MNRAEKRKNQRILQAIANKAKLDMQDYILSLSKPPTPEMLEAWKAGYIAGINRSTSNE
jgi:hypothetical protein